MSGHPRSAWPAAVVLAALLASACRPPAPPPAVTVRPPVAPAAPPAAAPAVPPADARRHLERARSLCDSGSWTAGIEEAARARAIDPSSAAARRLLAEGYVGRGREHMSARRWAAALNDLEQARALDPGHPGLDDALRDAEDGRDRLADRLYKEGIALYRNQRLREAIEAWDEVLRLNPAHGEAAKYREQACQILKRLEAGAE